jgi:hypothetical protein
MEMFLLIILLSLVAVAVVSNRVAVAVLVVCVRPLRQLVAVAVWNHRLFCQEVFHIR